MIIEIPCRGRCCVTISHRRTRIGEIIDRYTTLSGNSAALVKSRRYQTNCIGRTGRYFSTSWSIEEVAQHNFCSGKALVYVLPWLGMQIIHLNLNRSSSFCFKFGEPLPWEAHCYCFDQHLESVLLEDLPIISGANNFSCGELPRYMSAEAGILCLLHRCFLFALVICCLSAIH